MKYKNRKDAKRKYKKVALATVATMTLGVSVVGNTAFVFADETSTGTRQTALESLGTSGGGAGATSSKLEELLTMDNLKKVGTLSGDVLKVAYKDAHENNGNYNNTFRTLAMSGTALIPYGGVIISPLIGLLWPENVEAQKNQMKKLIDDLNNMMDQKITDNEIATIESEVNILKEMLQKFEKNINMNIFAGSFYSLTTKEQALAQDAKDINNKFSDIIGHCKQKLQVIPALPIFTAMATAHLEFLYFLEKNGTGPKLQYTTDALNTLLKGEHNEDFRKRINNLAETYVNHVQKTYELGKQQFNKKMDDTAKNTPGGNVNSTSEQETMSKMQKYIFDLHPVANNADEKRKQMQVALNNYVKLRNDRDQYYKNTANNEAFQLLAIGKWKREGDKWYFIDIKGEKKTSWIQLGEKRYYLSPNSGIMVKGFVTIEGKPYQFNDSGELIFSEGTYKIVYSKANKVVDFGAYGEQPVIWDYHPDWNTPNTNQQWEFKYDASKNAYQIINKQNNKVLAYNTTSGTDYTALVTENQHKAEHYWTLEDAGDGNILLVNFANKNKVLDVYGEETANGSKVYVRDKLNNSMAQKFKLIKLD